MRNITTVIFDLDGTLIDSRAGIINGLKDALLRCGYCVPVDVEIPVGPPLYDTIKYIFPNIKDEEIYKIVEAFREAYHHFDLPVSKPYEGAVEMLKTLKNYGVKSYIATYKPKMFSSKILEKYFKELYIDVITPTELPTWEDIVHNNCTKTDIVKFLIEKHNINPNNAIMAGDAITDIEAAHKNGLISIAANYGYGDNLEIANYQASNIEDMRQILMKHINREDLQKQAV